MRETEKPVGSWEIKVWGRGYPSKREQSGSIEVSPSVCTQRTIADIQAMETRRWALHTNHLTMSTLTVEGSGLA